MEDASANAQKDGNDNNDLHFKEEREENQSGFSNLSANRLMKRINPLHTLHFNVMQCRTRKSCIKNSVFPIGFGLLDERIPKRLVTIDEKYIQQCLELIHLSASKPARDNISFKLSLVKTSIPYEYLNLAKTRIGENCDVDKLIAASPLTSGSGSGVISPLGKWIVGLIMGSKSLMNIMKSPLFHQFGALENTSNSRKIDSNDSKESPYRTSQFSSQSRETGGSNWENHKDESESANEELVSTSGTFCSSSPQSTLGSAALYRGMLQCKWKDGIPYFVFSSDDHKENYEANLCKVNSADDKGSDYIYLFQTGKNGAKDNESYNEESRHAGKMTVSTAFSLCSNNSKIMETEFVLYGGIDKSEVEINSSGDNLRKKKLLPRKVVEAFRANPLSKQRSVSTFSGSISGRETPKNLEAVERFHLLENNLPSSFQLAAIVVKDHLRENDPDHNVGGWGLKFLKKVETKPTSHEKSMPFECFARSGGECSTSTDILIPAGIHGGPRTRIGGPSSLTERWRSGGLCDCGGWDLGCPLTKLKVWKSQEELLPEADMHGECKSVDIHVQGSEHGPPTLRMVNIRDDLYFIHFQRNLSSLQSFSIAVAIIHSRSPTLNPKNWPRQKNKFLGSRIDERE